MADLGDRTKDDGKTDSQPADDRGDAETTGPLARIKAAVTEAVGVVVDAVLDAL